MPSPALRASVPLIASLAFVSLAPAATAILECTASSNAGPRHSFFFRTSVVDAWTVERATLFLHAREGATPKSVMVGVQAAPSGWRGAAAPKLQRAAVVAEPQGWMRIDIPKDFVNGMIVDPNRQLVVQIPKGIEVDGKQPGLVSPYLVVEGAAATRQVRAIIR
ncbi:MAG: hypothetical protein U0Q16_30035 [Bryobacteraceae bacterium]